MRKTIFTPGEYYHIYNRGVDKRSIFIEDFDFQRFLQSMKEFNTIEPIGSIFENRHKKEQFGNLVSKLVKFTVFNLLENHFHFGLTPLVEHGVEKFMHRLGTGYTKYFNERYHRSGALFQGTYKAIHIDSNEYLLHLSVYINLNHRLHSFGSLASKPDYSSWGEYVKGAITPNRQMCNPTIILDQFGSKDHYKYYAEGVLPDIIRRKSEQKSLGDFLID